MSASPVVMPVVVIGSGLAGVMTALTLAPQPVLLVTMGKLGLSGSSMFAQGGIAASLGADDSAALHLADTLAAGDGLCDPKVAAEIVEGAADVIAALEDYGVRFDCKADGTYAFGLEAAHSRNRIVHVDGDASGAGIMQALAQRVLNTPSITVLEHSRAVRLIKQDGHIVGVELENAGPIAARAVVLATGGVGGLYEATTTPLGNLGQGQALGARVGAALSDMEFVQFHPTALAVDAPRLPLISEAVRGEGAILLNDRDERFMIDIEGQELAPRDVVARAIGFQLAQGRQVFLDAREVLGNGFAKRFPGIDALCKLHKIDPATGLIPVRPAAHYHMGGLATDADGRTSVAGLWAVGEVASTGLHGANRLASNSLLEAAYMGLRVGCLLGDEPSSNRQPLHTINQAPQTDINPIRAIVSQKLGLLRDEEGLREAVSSLLPMASTSDSAATALCIAVAAFDRCESRGSHARTDWPAKNAVSERQFYTLETVLARASEITEPTFIMRTA